MKVYSKTKHHTFITGVSLQSGILLLNGTQMNFASRITTHKGKGMSYTHLEGVIKLFYKEFYYYNDSGFPEKASKNIEDFYENIW